MQQRWIRYQHQHQHQHQHQYQYQYRPGIHNTPFHYGHGLLSEFKNSEARNLESYTPKLSVLSLPLYRLLRATISPALVGSWAIHIYPY
ncbi:hypothetical protein I7I50_05283 [Histoplasma capsulatum G186AR]|uniref:Uncharacterized protein n=1 Tax=Ajellomyces capsulatus TaxID=5037 RepID=A0A8H8D7M9_AJECA|nr:hypothetical protein I7I52_03542 [Histoplasma capsulatum]QSS75974.1 hypothetical protein I7I50_05283 [Histoplasma capsulatum G186AR]